MEQLNKHTEGEWFIPDYDNCLVLVGIDTVIADAIADIGVSYEEARANAHLIAAAPELLSSLEAMLEDSMYHDRDPDLPLRVIEVINKAKGELK